MAKKTTQDEPSYGFLTILEGAGGALLGGLLLVNRRGRPLEFHCTAPIVASRAEEILFGPTLRPHMHCERIGTALLSKVSNSPQLLVVDQLDSWPIAEETGVPVVLVDPRPSQAVDTATTSAPSKQLACLDQLDPTQRPDAEKLLADLTRYVDLAEPFERISEAIREAGLLGPSADEPVADEPPHAPAA